MLEHRQRTNRERGEKRILPLLELHLRNRSTRNSQVEMIISPIYILSYDYLCSRVVYHPLDMDFLRRDVVRCGKQGVDVIFRG